MKKLLFTMIAAASLAGCAKKPPAVDIWKAAATGNLAVIQQHLAFGTDVNAEEPVLGGTALIAAALTGQTEIAGLLLEKGARIDARNHDGATALMTAAFFGHPETVKLLLDKGADVNLANDRGHTPLDAVAGEWSPELERVYQYFAGALHLQLDLERLKTVRPVVANLLRQHGGKSSRE